MNVQVVNLLPAIRPGVDDAFKTIVTTVLSGQLRNQDHHFTEQGLIPGFHYGERGDMALRHEQKMHRCCRIDVVKCQNIVILEEFVAGDASRDDFAKNTVRIVHGVEQDEK